MSKLVIWMISAWLETQNLEEDVAGEDPTLGKLWLPLLDYGKVKNRFGCRR